MASGLNTSPRGGGRTIFPGMLVSLLQSVILSIIILFAADFAGISCFKAQHPIQTLPSATRPKFVEQDNQVVDLEQERQAASVRITHQHLDNEEHSVQPDQRNKISGDDWDPQSRLVWASPAVVHSDVNISPSNKMGTAIQQHEPENQKVDAAMESVSSVPSPLINVKAKHNLGTMAMTRATTEQTPGVESTEMRHYLDQSSPVTERDIDNLQADGYLISESGWIRKFTTTEMPAVDADILKTTQTDAKQNYTYIHVEYQIPADLKKCNRCVCHTQHTGSKVVVIADCKHKHFRKMDVPQNLPHYTYSLDLTSNDLQLRTFEAFSKYPFLINLLLDHNSIGSLEYTPQFIHPTITNLSLKYNNITQIKDFSFSSLPFLKTLYLSHNHLLQITRSTFASLSNLRQLDLSHNELIHIEPQAFYQCVNLDLLDLNQNFKLTYGTETLNNDLFSPLKKLRFLRIAGFQSSETSYPGFALAELISLEQLTLDGLKNVVLGPSVGALKKLSSLFIGDNGSCLLDSLTAYFFKNLSFLKELYIYFCPLTCLSADMYVNIPLIERLVFDRIHYGFDEFFSHLRGLTNSSVKELTLKGLLSHIGDPPCRYLTAQHVQHIHDMIHLEVLSLTENEILFITSDFINGLPQSLRELHLARNLLIKQRSVLFLISSLPHLRILNEDRQNQVNYFQPNPGSTNTMAPKSANSQSCQSRSSGPVDTRMPNSYEFEEDHVPAEDHSQLHLNLSLYSSVQSFQFGELYLRQDPVNTAKAQTLNISGAFIGGLRDKYLSAMVQVVDLSNSSWDSLSDNFFQPDNILREVHMQNNFLGSDLSQDFDGVKFSQLIDVQYLDISTNYIQELPQPIFRGLKNIKIINLANNNIRSLNIKVVHMTSLIFVDLSNNNLNWISKKTRDDLDTIALDHKVALDLTSNPLPCTCSGMELFHWMVTTKVFLLKTDFLLCEDDTKQLSSIGDLQTRLAALQRKCISSILVIQGASLSGVITLIIVTGLLLFRNRWKLHYLRNLAITKIYGFKPRNIRDNHYPFDAYVLFSDEDRDFVIGECLRELEETRGHKLCIEDRDFLPGSVIPCNITSAVHNSRLTIPIISPDFWEGEWCEYGLQMAVVESNHTKRNVLHLLIYREVPVEDMPRDLIKVHNDNNFSEYPPADCSDDVKAAFWDALSRIIGHTSNQEDNPRLNLDMIT